MCVCVCAHSKNKTPFSNEVDSGEGINQRSVQPRLPTQSENNLATVTEQQQQQQQQQTCCADSEESHEAAALTKFFLYAQSINPAIKTK